MSSAAKFFEVLVERMDEVLPLLQARVSSCGYPVYASLDIRDSGWKVCAVDVNLFPAGFNVLTANDRARGSQRMREFLAAKLLKTAPWKITVVPESHTNNAGYLENLSGILGLLREAGCEVRLAWSGPPIPKAWPLKTASGAVLEYLPPQVALEGADAILLNHDLSGGLPAFLKDVHLPTFPSPKLGWYRRRKSDHQQIVEGLLKSIARQLDFFDPWYFAPLSWTIPLPDLSTDEGIDHLANKVDQMIETLKRGYGEREIGETPRVFVKNDAGTYGLGVLSVASGQEVRERRKWIQEKMRKGKGAVAVENLILQEAVPTALSYGADENLVVGEPVLYLVNGLAIGGFLRIQEKLGSEGRWLNLNQPGAKLEALDCVMTRPEERPFAKIRGRSPCEQLSLPHVYAFIARLHATAAGLEECPA